MPENAVSSRRALLAGLGLLPLVACQTTTPVTPPAPIPPPAWVAGLEAIATEAQNALNQLAAVGLNLNVTVTVGGVSMTVSQIISTIQTLAASIGSASTQAEGQATLTQIEDYINALAPLILPFVSLIPGGSIIGLIVAALPALETMLNIAVSILSPTAVQVAQSAPPAPTSAARAARATLGLPNSLGYLQELEQLAGITS
jgi:hypothetical protein